MTLRHRSQWKCPTAIQWRQAPASGRRAGTAKVYQLKTRRTCCLCCQLFSSSNPEQPGGWNYLESCRLRNFRNFLLLICPLRCSRRIHARQRRNRAPVIRQKVMPIRAAVSMKNGSGTMLIRRSVRGSSCQRSLVKKILWKIIKYFVKSVEMIPASRRSRPEIKPSRRRASVAAGVLTEP